ncbi:MAG: hypothetical protein AAAB35_00500 [Phyllobacterium sp.]|uniref:hypothetical protein n=1 Tax=Phyllobacterium sp. TaxID=1871046 RepID=UPI0030F113AF
MMFIHTMSFLQKLKVPVSRSQEPLVKTTVTPAKAPLKRAEPDSDGQLRRLRQLVEHNRLI